MKKSLIALAVAGAFAAPAFAASSNVDVYGTLRYSLDHVSRNNGGTSNWTINDQTSRFGIKGSEDLGGGLKAVWQIEQQISSTGGPLDSVTGNPLNAVTKVGTSAGAVTTVSGASVNRDSAFGGAGLRNTFVGLAGGFGTVIIGRHDTPYKLGGSADLFGDTSADAQKNTTGIIGRNGFDNRISGTVAYISPDWSGFHFAVATVPGEGTTAGSAHGLSDAVSMVAVYANGPLKATLGHESLSKKIGAGTESKQADKFNIGYTIGDVALGYTYERADQNFTDSTRDVSQLASVGYNMGPITLAAQWGKYNDKHVTDADLTRWTVGVIYNLSKRTNVYVAYDSDNNKPAAAIDAKVLTMGVNTTF